MEYKICTRCKQSFPATVYWFPTRKKPNGRYGFNLRENCRKCATARKVESARRNPETYKAISKRWRDNGGGEKLREKYATDEEYRQKRIQDTLDYQKNNPEKVNAKNSRWMKNNPERAKAIRKRTYEKNKDKRNRHNQEYNLRPEVKERKRMWDRMNYDPIKAKAKAAKRRALGTVSVYTIREMLAEQENKCAYCGIDMGNKPTLEHILAVENGGTNDRENLCMVCYHCNSSKKDIPLEVWRVKKFG